MESLPEHIWLCVCAHQLQQRWRSIDPLELEAVARDIWEDPKWRGLGPEEAAQKWLEPIAQART